MEGRRAALRAVAPALGWLSALTLVWLSKTFALFSVGLFWDSFKVPPLMEVLLVLGAPSFVVYYPRFTGLFFSTFLRLASLLASWFFKKKQPTLFIKRMDLSELTLDDIEIRLPSIDATLSCGMVAFDSAKGVNRLRVSRAKALIPSGFFDSSSSSSSKKASALKQPFGESTLAKLFENQQTNVSVEVDAVEVSVKGAATFGIRDFSAMATLSGVEIAKACVSMGGVVLDTVSSEEQQQQKQPEAKTAAEAAKNAFRSRKSGSSRGSIVTPPFIEMRNVNVASACRFSLDDSASSETFFSGAPRAELGTTFSLGYFRCVGTPATLRSLQSLTSNASSLATSSSSSSSTAAVASEVEKTTRPRDVGPKNLVVSAPAMSMEWREDSGRVLLTACCAFDAQFVSKNEFWVSWGGPTVALMSSAKKSKESSFSSSSRNLDISAASVRASPYKNGINPGNNVLENESQITSEILSMESFSVCVEYDSISVKTERPKLLVDSADVDAMEDVHIAILNALRAGVSSKFGTLAPEPLALSEAFEEVDRTSSFSTKASGTRDDVVLDDEDPEDENDWLEVDTTFRIDFELSNEGLFMATAPSENSKVQNSLRLSVCEFSLKVGLGVRGGIDALRDRRVGARALRSVDLRCRDIRLKSRDLELLDIPVINTTPVHNLYGVRVSNARVDLSAAPLVRLFRLWNAFDPKLSAWEDNVSAVAALAEAERTGRAVLSTKPVVAESFNNDDDVNLMQDIPIILELKLIDNSFTYTMDEHVHSHRAMRLTAKSIVLSTEKSASCSSVVLGCSLNDGRFEDVVKIEQFEVSKSHITIRTLGVFHGKAGTFGESQQLFFSQRKALRREISSLRSSMAAASRKKRAAAGLPAFNKSQNKSTRTEDETDEAWMRRLYEHHIASIDFRKVVVHNFSLVLEDDDLQDDVSKCGFGIFPHFRRKRMSHTAKQHILTVKAKKLEASVGLHDKGNPYLIEKIRRLDSMSTPKQRVDVAVKFGFAEVLGATVERFRLESFSMSVSDHPLSMVEFKVLESDEESLFVLADVKPVPSATRDVVIRLPSADGTDEILVSSQSNATPLKLYPDLRNASISGLKICTGDPLNPAMIALDRAMGRFLPKSSDTRSPMLGWWDRLRYMVHGRIVLNSVSEAEVRILTYSPFVPEEALFLSVDAFKTLEADAIEPTNRIDVRNWSFELKNFVVSLSTRTKPFGKSKKPIRERVSKKLMSCSSTKLRDYSWRFDRRPVLVAPLVDAALSFAWRCDAGGDHYVHLHHQDVVDASQVKDAFKFFRAKKLSLGLDFAVKSSLQTTSDFPLVKFSTTTKFDDVLYPGVFMSFREVYPRICEILRAFNPARIDDPSKPNLGRLFKELTLNVRCEQAHLMWTKDDSSESGVLLRCRHLDSRTVFKKVANTDKLEHEAVLTRFAAVEGYAMERRATRGNSAKNSSQQPKHPHKWGLEFLEPSYVYGVGFPHAPLASTPAMKLTLGLWPSLTKVATKHHVDAKRLSKHAHLLVVDELRLVWSLKVRDIIFRFFAELTYTVRKEARFQEKIDKLFEAEIEKFAKIHNLNPSNRRGKRGSSTKNGDFAETSKTRSFDEFSSELTSVAKKFMSPRMKMLLATSSSDAPKICDSGRFEDSEGEENDEDDPNSKDSLFTAHGRKSACSSRREAPDGLKRTQEEEDREFTFQLRWIQLNLAAGTSLGVVNAHNCEVVGYRKLFDPDELNRLLDIMASISAADHVQRNTQAVSESATMARKEVDVGAFDATIHTATLSGLMAKKFEPSTIWLHSKKTLSDKYCVQSELYDDDLTSKTTRGVLTTTELKFKMKQRKLLKSVQNASSKWFTAWIEEKMSEELDNAFSAFDSPKQRDELILSEIRSYQEHNNFRGDIALESLSEAEVGITACAHVPGFKVTDIVYTDMRGGTRTPTDYLGIDVPKLKADLISSDFFVVMNVIKDLIIVPPPQDVSELQLVAELEDREFAKKGFKQDLDEMIERIKAREGDKILKLTDPGLDPGDNAGLTDEVVKRATAIYKHEKTQLQWLVECLIELREANPSAGARRIAYLVDYADLALLDDSRAAQLTGTLKNLKGNHSISLEGSAELEIQLGNLHIQTPKSGASAAPRDVLKSSATVSDAPLLKVDARTSAQFLLDDTRITVYELLQFHLYPGSTYQLNADITTQVSSFASKYFHDEDPEFDIVPDDLTAERDTARRGSTLKGFQTIAKRKTSFAAAKDDLISSFDEQFATEPSANLTKASTRSRRGRRRMSLVGKKSSSSAQTATASIKTEELEAPETTTAQEEDSPIVDLTDDEPAQQRNPIPFLHQVQALPASVFKQVSKPMRVGSCQRRHVPKKGGQIPWERSKIRKNIVHFVYKSKENQFALVFHRNEVGVKLRLPVRATIELKHLKRVELSKDGTAPPGALDLVFASSSAAMQKREHLPGQNDFFTVSFVEEGEPKDPLDEEKAPPHLLWLATMLPALNENALSAEIALELETCEAKHALEKCASVTRKVLSLLHEYKDGGLTQLASTTPTNDSSSKSFNDSSLNDSFEKLDFSGYSSALVPFVPKTHSDDTGKFEMPEYNEIAYFKYIRLGPLDVTVSMLGFHNRSAQANAIVYHQLLASWAEYLKKLRWIIGRSVLKSLVGFGKKKPRMLTGGAASSNMQGEEGEDHQGSGKSSIWFRSIRRARKKSDDDLDAAAAEELHVGGGASASSQSAYLILFGKTGANYKPTRVVD